MTQRILAIALGLVALSVEMAGATGFGHRFRPGRCGDGSGWSRGGFFRFNGLEVVGLTADQRLICFDEDSPSLARAIGPITNLSGDARIVGIDFRPATGELYGLGNAGGIYTINLANGSAIFEAQLNVALDGTLFDVDFNPTVDRLRIISDAGQNLRANVETGMTTEDFDLVYPGPTPTPGLGVTGAAYTNNDLDATTATTLFDIDATMDQVVIQSPPNNGSLAATGKLSVDAVGDVGFDIYSIVRGGKTSDVKAFAAITTDRARFYRINLFTGRALLRGTFNQSQQVSDIALPLNQY
jgi:hypothetical protein